MPASLNLRLRMFARWGGLFIQPFTISSGEPSVPDPQARSSPRDGNALAGTYPTLRMRSTNDAPFKESWEKKPRATMSSEWPSAAFARRWLELSGLGPREVRSWFTRHNAEFASDAVDVCAVGTSTAAQT